MSHSARANGSAKLNGSAVKEKQSWLTKRDALVARALAAHDVDTLARISSLPGGFGSSTSRRRAWRELLNVSEEDNSADGGEMSDAEADGVKVETPHPDEQQVLLDIRRAFVTYPRDISRDDKEAMQEDLQTLIVSILQRHPTLSYFQGFHDIMSVLYLTLLTTIPRSKEEKRSSHDRHEWAELFRSAEVVSLSRVRDAMGKGLGPMMGMLRLLRRLLAAADPQLYKISSSISPVPTLPFFALSWILTLFSHDVDTLEPVQRIFDYLIARNPISAIYLAVAILISKKPQMIKLASELGSEARRDPSLLHPLFARLPPLYSDTPDAPTPDPAATLPKSVIHDEPNPYTPLCLSAVFSLADKLMVKFPWDGPEIRGREVMGPGSVVRTYPLEMSSAALKDGVWTLVDAEAVIDEQVVMPGGDALEDDAIETTLGRLLPPWSLSFGFPIHLPSDRIGTAVAFGIIALGVGVAMYGWRAGGPDASWGRWWGLVAGKWVAKGKETARQWVTVGGFVGRAIREV